MKIESYRGCIFGLPSFVPDAIDYGNGVYAIEAMANVPGTCAIQRSSDIHVLTISLSMFIKEHPELRVVSTVFEKGYMIVVTEQRQ